MNKINENCECEVHKDHEKCVEECICMQNIETEI